MIMFNDNGTRKEKIKKKITSYSEIFFILSYFVDSK